MFKLAFRTANAAFQDEDSYAVAEVIRGVAKACEEGRTSGAVMDYNGNTVGSWSIYWD